LKIKLKSYKTERHSW